MATIEVWLPVQVEVSRNGKPMAFAVEREGAHHEPTKKVRRVYGEDVPYDSSPIHVVWVKATVPVPEHPADVCGEVV